MILTVTLNAALDLTYSINRVAWGDTNRVAAVFQRAGGKGLNVARVLHALGDEAVAAGLAGGWTGDAIRADLARSGLSDELDPIDGESRRTVAIVDEEAHETTVFNERGPTISEREWTAFQAHYQSLLPRARVVVLSGSVPPGLPRAAYRTLAEAAAAAGRAVILDADGDVLREGLAGRPTIAKPNLGELAGFVGRPLAGLHQIAAAAEVARAAGAREVVVTLGAEGLLAQTAEATWHARPPTVVTGNATGAGDAAVAALASGLLHERPLAERLADAVALSAASVCAPAAGEFAAGAYRAWRTAVRVERL